MPNRKQSPARRDTKVSAGIVLFCPGSVAAPGNRTNCEALACGLRNGKAVSACEALRALVVRKRFTYAFSEFVHGKYSRFAARPISGSQHGSRKSSGALARMFAKMTTAELLDIQSLNFDMIWSRLWHGRTDGETYRRRRAKFESLVLHDGGRAVRSAVGAVDVKSTVPWEIPKGHKQFSSETDLSCAIRELGEETGFRHDSFVVLPNFSRVVSYTQHGTRYVTTYFPAILKPGRSARCRGNSDWRVAVPMANRQMVAEISEIRWMDVNDIRMVDDEHKHLETTIRPFFKYAKKHLRFSWDDCSKKATMCPSQGACV